MRLPLALSLTPAPTTSPLLFAAALRLVLLARRAGSGLASAGMVPAGGSEQPLYSYGRSRSDTNWSISPTPSPHVRLTTGLESQHMQNGNSGARSAHWVGTHVAGPSLLYRDAVDPTEGVHSRDGYGVGAWQAYPPSGTSSSSALESSKTQESYSETESQQAMLRADPAHSPLVHPERVSLAADAHGVSGTQFLKRHDAPLPPDTGSREMWHDALISQSQSHESSYERAKPQMDRPFTWNQPSSSPTEFRAFPSGGVVTRPVTAAGPSLLAPTDARGSPINPFSVAQFMVNKLIQQDERFVQDLLARHGPDLSDVSPGDVVHALASSDTTLSRLSHFTRKHFGPTLEMLKDAHKTLVETHWSTGGLRDEGTELSDPETAAVQLVRFIRSDPLLHTLSDIVVNRVFPDVEAFVEADAGDNPAALPAFATH
ncbi:hypothetical protein BESB_020880 [Besnoitia besnoiti]|uniref:Uncharacterized protein n=1 Tax=Besnoitia besnoiti TaxID=94643 RepID=A0A2A9M950_BESBE|nr:hypothetical protein BESB_020880 [Besnoitia besnoiti]PFH32147.1 hypothetical protein BESB_020880 [Besnoitia besnoiti]